MRILVVMPGERPKELEIEGSLKSMQNIVGGLIQAIYSFDDPVALICNDEGKLLGLEPNRALKDPETGSVYDIICGNFFVCGLSEDNFTSLAPDLVSKYSQHFHTPEQFIRIGNKILIY